jgi:hypothetical protein
MPAVPRRQPTRILVAECIHEVCTFNPVPTRYDDFLVHRGSRMFPHHRGIGSEVTGVPSARFSARSGRDVLAGRGAFLAPRPGSALSRGNSWTPRASRSSLG